jgi:hypothetical protein
VAYVGQLNYEIGNRIKTMESQGNYADVRWKGKRLLRRRRRMGEGRRASNTNTKLQCSSLRFVKSLANWKERHCEFLNKLCAYFVQSVFEECKYIYIPFVI